MPEHTFQDFLAGKIGIRCDTRDEYDRLMQECDVRGIQWNSGNPAIGPTPSKAVQYGEPETFRLYGKRLVYNIFDADSAVPLSAIFPADPWAEFVAGKCYLRVTKEEWPEFARRCEAAGMKWPWDGMDKKPTAFGTQNYALMFIASGYSYSNRLDALLDGRNPIAGKPICDFSAIARPAPKKPEPQPYDGRGKHKAGDLFEVIPYDTPNEHCPVGSIIELVRDDGSSCPYFRKVGQALEFDALWARLKPYTAPPARKIVITTDADGRVTTAKLYEGDEAVMGSSVARGEDSKPDFLFDAARAVANLLPDTAVLMTPGQVDTALNLLNSAAQTIREASA